MTTGPAPAGPSLDGDANSSLLSWEGDRMFHIYIHDYCNKRGYTKTARELVNEADIPPDSQPPINARQGLLFEWWSVFWTLFTAKNNGTGSDEALIYTQYQVQQQALRAQNRNQPQPPINRMMNGIPTRQPLLPPNGGGLPNGMPGGQGMPNGHMSFPMSNQPGHPPSGPGNTPGGPQQPINMQGMMPGQRTMGGVPQPQQPGQGMVQMSGNQHMGPMNRTMLPPNAPPNMANHVPGNQPQAHSPNYPQIVGRPSSRPSTPGQGMIMNPSPSMANRLPPGPPTISINEINAELMRIPNTTLSKIKQELTIPMEKEFPTMNQDEKHRIFTVWRTKYRAQLQPGPGAPQQPPNPAGSSSTPLMAAANVRNNPTAPQRAKRNSTSPGEEEGSSPKRPRPSPSGGDHPNPPGPPQGPPPMASMMPFNQPQGGGPPGPQNMQNGMVRQMNMAYPTMTGFPTQVSPGMGSMPTPAMMNNMTPEVGPMQNYRQAMQKAHHKGMGPPNAGSPLTNPPQTAGGTPFTASGMNPAAGIKPVGGMMPPPPSPGINKAQQNGTDKPGEPGVRPESSPGQGPQSGHQNPGQPSQPPSGVPQQSQQAQQPSQIPQQPPTGQPGPGQGPPPNPAPATPSAPSMGAEVTGGLMDLQQTAMGGLTDLPWDVDFEQTFLRQDPGDLNFERDFGQWFNPGGDMTIDMK